MELLKLLAIVSIATAIVYGLTWATTPMPIIIGVLCLVGFVALEMLKWVERPK